MKFLGKPSVILAALVTFAAVQVAGLVIRRRQAFDYYLEAEAEAEEESDYCEHCGSFVSIQPIGFHIEEPGR